MVACRQRALEPVRRRRRHEDPRAGVRLDPRAHDPQLPGLPAALQAPAHHQRRVQRVVRAHRARRPPGAAALRRPRRARGGHPLRCRDHRRPDLEAGARHLLVHRVRALPGRLPRLRHRQGPVSQAGDHGPARPAVHRRRRDRGRPRRWRRRRGQAGAGPQRGPRGIGLGLRDLRRLRAGVPGLHRARRPHRRSAPPPRDGRVQLPLRGRADAEGRRALLQPVGQGAVRARRLGRRPQNQSPPAG